MYSFQKVCTERFQMDIGKAKPIVIEKGTPTVIPIYAIQNDPAYWEDPKSFKPERFMKKEDVEAKSKGIYLPFGDGPRMCPGELILAALKVVENVLATHRLLVLCYFFYKSFKIQAPKSRKNLSEFVGQKNFKYCYFFLTGSRVAITIIKLAVVHILTEMEVLTSSKTPKEIDYDPTYFLLSHKGGIHLKFAERN